MRTQKRNQAIKAIADYIACAVEEDCGRSGIGIAAQLGFSVVGSIDSAILDIVVKHYNGAEPVAVQSHGGIN